MPRPSCGAHAANDLTTSVYRGLFGIASAIPASSKVTQDFLWRIKERYDISGALLFGSRARGTHHATSDADVAVILRGEPRRLLPTKLDMLDAAYDIMLESDIRISPLPIWIEEWEHPEDYSNDEAGIADAMPKNQR